MVPTILFIALVVIVAILLFILIDRAGQPSPIGIILKLLVLLIALYAVANRLGYA
jgi:hypothetical protein